MGSPKRDLFLDRIAAVAAPLFDEVVVVERSGGATAVQRTIFEEPHEGEGAIFGLARALGDARGRCFILAVDYPLITRDLLLFLLEAFARSAAAAVVPVWDSHPQPLCAGYDASLLPLVERHVLGGDLRLRSLIEKAGAEMIAEAELRKRFPGEPLMNVNTPEELEAAVRLYG